MPKNRDCQPAADPEHDGLALNVSDCTWPWTWLYVLQNGEVKPCCYAPMPIGKVQDVDTVMDLWNSPVMEDLRSAVSANKVHRICAGAGCSYVRAAVPRVTLDEFRIYADPIPPGLVPERTRRLAWIGRMRALYSVGDAFYKAGDIANARLWLMRAGEAGDPLAGVLLATIEFAQSKSNDLSASTVGFLEIGARESYAPACSTLASQFLAGSSVTGRDLDRAEALLKQGMAKRDPFSFMYMGSLYQGACGMETWSGKPDLVRARHYYAQALRLGTEGAQAQIDHIDALAAARNPEPVVPSDFSLAQGFYESGDVLSARQCLAAAGDAGDPHAGVLLASIEFAVSGNIELSREAVAYLKNGVKEGYSPAFSTLALQYLSGALFTGRDLNEGEKLLKEGVKKHDPYSLHLMGMLHAGLYGSDTWSGRPNLARARRYFEKAKTMGIADAALQLGRMDPDAKLQSKKTG